MKEAGKETRSQHSKLTYNCGLWIYASNHVCPNKYKAVALSCCVLLPPTAQSTASAIGAPGIQRFKKSKIQEQYLSPLPTHSVFWSLKFCVLKFEVYGVPQVESGRNQLFVLRHMENNSQKLISDSKGSYCCAHPGFTLVGILYITLS